MKKGIILATLFGFCLLFAGGISGQEDEEEDEAGWETYRAEKYGFEMLAPANIKFKEKENDNGWGGLYARSGIIQLYGLAKLDAEESAEAIEKYGIKISGLDAEYWKKLDEGKNENGWKWYRLYKATDEEVVIYAGLGVGARGSYLLFLKTTAEDDEEYAEHYEYWYNSLSVFEEKPSKKEK